MIRFVILLILALSLPSCAHSPWPAFNRCELTNLPQTAQAAAQCAQGALVSSGNWQAAVFACGMGLGPGQLNCIISAIVSANAPAPGLSTGHQPGPLIYERGNEFLNTHQVQ